MPDTIVDVLVVGAGPAGLTAALYLARFRRRVLVLHHGASRASMIPTTRNYPGFPDGISGNELLQRLRAQAERYGARIEEGLVEALERGDGVFSAVAGGRRVRARKVLLATGIVDEEPEMANLHEAIDAGCIRLCPICDGHEVMDRSVAVYGPPDDAASHAAFMRTFTGNVTLVSPRGCAPPGEKARRILREAGVRLLAQPAAEIFLTADRRAGVRLADGTTHSFATLYPALGSRPRTELAIRLGAKCDRAGEVEVDSHNRTAVPGLFAAGDVVSALNQLSVAVGHAAIAATTIHNELPREERGSGAAGLAA